MKRTASAIALFLAAAAWTLAQDQSKPRTHTETTVKHSGPGPDSKTKMESVTGIVKEYEAGKKLVVTGPNNKDYRFDLDEKATLTGPVAVGERVKVTYQKGDAGERVTVVARYTGKV